jgi:hypothetical protein
MSDDVTTLDKVLAKASGAVIAIEYALCYNNFDGYHPGVTDRFRWLPIENSYFGDVPEIFATIAASGVAGRYIEDYGIRKENKFLQWLGRKTPAITAAVVGTYYTLGETGLPLLPGTADVRDIPAVIITAISSMFVANYIRKTWHNMKDKTLGMIAAVNT